MSKLLSNAPDTTLQERQAMENDKRNADLKDEANGRKRAARGRRGSGRSMLVGTSEQGVTKDTLG